VKSRLKVISVGLKLRIETSFGNQKLIGVFKKGDFVKQ
jgi:hypothetical protein